MSTRSEKNADYLLRLLASPINKPQTTNRPAACKRSEVIEASAKSGFVHVVTLEQPTSKKKRRVEGPKRNGPDIDSTARYIPTPEEIAEAAAEIRATWSKRELESLCQFPKPVPVEVQTTKSYTPTKRPPGDY